MAKIFLYFLSVLKLFDFLGYPFGYEFKRESLEEGSLFHVNADKGSLSSPEDNDTFVGVMEVPKNKKG